MSEESGGASGRRDTAGAADRTSPNIKNRSRNRRPNVGGRRFQGTCEALRNAVYDIYHVVDNYELFNTTTEAIGEYVAREYEHAGEYRRGLPDLNLATLEAPPPPDDTSNTVDMEMWKIKLKKYSDRAEHVTSWGS